MQNLLSFLRLRAKDFPTPYGQRIWATAKNLLGYDVSPRDLAPDEYGCAETVSNIIIDSGYIFPEILSTAELYKYLKNSPNWAPVGTPLAGDIIISPTGMGGKNGVLNGHTGIIMSNNKDGVVIASNNSWTGNFDENYTLASWKRRYQDKGGYPIYYFRRITN